MIEYIERDAAINAVFEAYADGRSAYSALEAIPADDVVEVVRCRECKYREEDNFCTGRGWPKQMVTDDGFCEKGKRKDGGQDDV